MKLTEEVKKSIDSMTDEQFFGHWRYSLDNIELFFGESGQYCVERFRKLQKQPNFSELSKKVGWQNDLWKM